ncbi:hypothetical protein R3I94_008756 [Phoxinus phoxinus]
MPVFTLSG